MRASKDSTREELEEILRTDIPITNSVPSAMESTFRLLVVADLLAWALFVLAMMVYVMVQ